jgi:hypothetical protein
MEQTAWNQSPHPKKLNRLLSDAVLNGRWERDPRPEIFWMSTFLAKRMTNVPFEISVYPTKWLERFNLLYTPNEEIRKILEEFR